MSGLGAGMQLDPNSVWAKLEGIDKGVRELQVGFAQLHDAVMGNGKDPLQRQIDGVGARINAIETWQTAQIAVKAEVGKRTNTFREWIIPIVAICSLLISAFAIMRRPPELTQQSLRAPVNTQEAFGAHK